MMKKIFCLILTAVLFAWLLPLGMVNVHAEVTENAAFAGEVKIGGVELNEENNYTVADEDGDGSASFDPATATLTLENFSAAPQDDAFFSSYMVGVINIVGIDGKGESVTIELIGENALEVLGDTYKYGIYAEYVDLRICSAEGEAGSLKINGENYDDSLYGIMVWYGSAEIENIDLEVTGMQRSGISPSDNMMIQGSTVRITGCTQNGISLPGSLTIQDSDVYAESGYIGIFCSIYPNELKIINSSVEAKATGYIEGSDKAVVAAAIVNSEENPFTILVPENAVIDDQPNDPDFCTVFDADGAVATHVKIVSDSYKPSEPETDVVSYDLTWGAMDFTYTQGMWNPETHAYDGGAWAANHEDDDDLICIENTSEKQLNVSFAFEAEMDGLSGSFVEAFGESTEPFAGPVAVKRDGVLVAQLVLSGDVEPFEGTQPIGTITLTVSGPQPGDADFSVSDENELTQAINYGGTIELLSDIEITNDLYIEQDTTLTLGDHQICSEDCSIEASSDLSISGGTIDVNKIYVKSGAKLELNDSEIVNELKLSGAQAQVSGSQIGDCSLQSGSTITVMDGSKIGEMTAADAEDKVEINGGEVENLAVYNGSTVAMTDGEVSILQAVNGASVTITGGTVDLLSTDLRSSVTIIGGTFGFDPTAYLGEGCTVVENSDGTYTVSKHEHDFTGGACSCGFVQVSTIEQLTAALENGGKIDVACDLNFGNTVYIVVCMDTVLNLNGHKIQGGAVFEVIDYADLTINGENGEISSITGYMEAGTITINDCTVNTLEQDCYDVVLNNSPVINYIQREYSGPISIVDGNKVDNLIVCYEATISGGEVGTLTAEFLAEVTITGGKIGLIDADADAEIIINGGTFDFDPSEYVDTDQYSVDYNDGCYSVTPKA